MEKSLLSGFFFPAAPAHSFIKGPLRLGHEVAHPLSLFSPPAQSHLFSLSTLALLVSPRHPRTPSPSSPSSNAYPIHFSSLPPRPHRQPQSTSSRPSPSIRSRLLAGLVRRSVTLCCIPHLHPLVLIPVSPSGLAPPRLGFVEVEGGIWYLQGPFLCPRATRNPHGACGSSSGCTRFWLPSGNSGVGYPQPPTPCIRTPSKVRRYPVALV